MASTGEVRNGRNGVAATAPEPSAGASPEEIQADLEATRRRR